MNMVYFPVACRISGRIWHGGRAFESKQELIDSLSAKDWRRVVEWERRDAGWVLSKRSGGDKKRGGAA
jgi:hypothetical protein